MRERLQPAVARYDGLCPECRRPIVRNAVILYDTKLKRTLCKPCGDALRSQEGELFQK